MNSFDAKLFIIGLAVLSYIIATLWDKYGAKNKRKKKRI